MLPVKNGDAMPVRRILAHLRPVVQCDEALRHSHSPDVRMHLWETVKQVLEYRWRRILDLGKIKARRTSLGNSVRHMTVHALLTSVLFLPRLHKPSKARSQRPT